MVKRKKKAVDAAVAEANRPCKDRVRPHFEGRIAAIAAMLKAEQEGKEDGDEAYGPLHEYGLSFDYVTAGTFNDQKEGYWRYQLSWGGPADEFRFYGDPQGKVHRVEYWFLDWGDGASIDVTEHKTVRGLVDWFEGFDGFRSALAKALEES